MYINNRNYDVLYHNGCVKGPILSLYTLIYILHEFACTIY